MNVFRTMSYLSLAAFAVALDTSQAEASPPPTIACGTAMNDYFTGTLPGDWLSVVGVRLSARGTFGFSSFTMANGYNLSTTPLNTPAAASQSTFTANKGSNNYEGLFREVFPGRGNNDVDQWDFWVYKTGEVWLRSITWGGSWAQLQGVTCSRTPQNQTAITGYSYTPGYGTDYWTFVVVGGQLI
jgi:hypothetical protein